MVYVCGWKYMLSYVHCLVSRCDTLSCTWAMHCCIQRLLHSAPVGQLTLQHAHMTVGHVWESGKPEQGGMPPTRQNTTRRNAAKQTNQNRQANIYKAEYRRTNQPKQGGMPPTRQTKTDKRTFPTHSNFKPEVSCHRRFFTNFHVCR